MIISNVCWIQLDHYKVNWVEGLFQVNGVVWNYSWNGELVITQYVAENPEEMDEGVGQD
jgi:predicted DNA-binding helix-hairpin-helix protein